MIIPNPVTKLDYNPVTDVLAIDWPDFTEYALSEVEYILESVIEVIKNYDVRYLLADTRNGTITLSDEKYNNILHNFALNLNQTRLKKLARVVTIATLREHTVKEIAQKADLDVPIRNFDRTEDALHWLNSKD